MLTYRPSRRHLAFGERVGVPLVALTTLGSAWLGMTRYTLGSFLLGGFGCLLQMTLDLTRRAGADGVPSQAERE